MVGLEGVEGGVGLMVGWEWELGGGLWWHRAWLMGRDMVCNGVSACLRVDGRSGAGGEGVSSWVLAKAALVDRHAGRCKARYCLVIAYLQIVAGLPSLLFNTLRHSCRI